MNIGIEYALQNIGMSIEYVVLLVFVIMGSLIWFAKDFKLGLFYLFFGSALGYMGLKALGEEYQKLLIMVFIALILMSFAIYSIDKGAKRGQFV